MDALLRETTTGRVRGQRVQGSGGGRALAWLGVPYASPAVDALRFAPPRPHPGWARVRDASRYGPDVLQPLDPSVTLTASREGSLLLNVWVPEENPDGRPLPVLFWMHGGAFRGGSARQYDGRDLALRGAVVVTVNSRLGPLGYANFGELFGDARFTPNAGFQDQVAALHWVAANAAAFGGDPARVTVAGESAGAVAAALMLTHPRTRPLVAGAVLQSGALNQVSGRDNSVDIARAYADALGVRRDNLNDLWTLPPGAFLRALHALERVRARRLNSRPFLDGHWLPGSEADLLAAPRADVPLLIGANREEYSPFVKLPDRIFPRTDRTYLANVLDRQATPEQTLRVLAAYPDTQAGLVALGTDMFFHVPNDRFVDAVRPGHASGTWRYRFDWGTRLFGLGAAHGMELLFLWPRPMGSATRVMRGPDGAAVAALAERMQRAWMTFVREGHPGPDWPTYTAAHPSVAFLGTDGRLPGDAGDAERRHVWRDVRPFMP
ncbi:carboxylesterase/lipase family protein [Deinococcus aquiradiocola]|uniref:Carboxylic ester hydrolase n=1 Tax=Deinococcus aquiradiocola TaxID=393059 RepID=A0A917PPK9_9DEIO|nr:carboxylesterase family protein [Deinococcus aquiradiocola]GGJ86579.1 carboxylesterase [Deinococcus aquiradiocola]